jgi:hypothetical protein
MVIVCCEYEIVRRNRTKLRFTFYRGEDPNVLIEKRVGCGESRKSGFHRVKWANEGLVPAKSFIKRKHTDCKQ